MKQLVTILLFTTMMIALSAAGGKKGGCPPGEEVKGICCCHSCKKKVNGRWQPIQQFMPHSTNKVIIDDGQAAKQFCHNKCLACFLIKKRSIAHTPHCHYT
ncbi:uncharacterized protein ACA1_389050 [Acanthamoeba castellanii str. Neff]|uniref:Uncharacterized protein n=1 Tax=Acanthamoeba castellanii (strain ATCC 30010 / Neff) TaxID=1257118 RepID=L8GEC0_ACACF|nr:uncharacterized protein ACA1_389050 [Acanthamoeba castellanii str. Neff]ELR11194.1 hypothetical protein ACA1_389050 [Acanthamoeba castellanii str. Neff]